MHRTLTDEAERDGTNLTMWVLEAAIFRAAYQRAERGEHMREALREAWTDVAREQQLGQEASDRLRKAITAHAPDLLAEAIRRLEEWDPAAAKIGRSVYGVPDGHYTPQDTP